MRWWWTEAHPPTCLTWTCTSTADSSPRCRETVRPASQYCSPHIIYLQLVDFLLKPKPRLQSEVDLSQRLSVSRGTTYTWGRSAESLWWIASLSLSSRSDCVHTYRQHSVCCCSRSLHDPPQRAGHNGHPHLPTLALLQAHRGACGCRAHGKNEADEAGLMSGCLEWWLSVQAPLEGFPEDFPSFGVFPYRAIFFFFYHHSIMCV